MTSLEMRGDVTASWVYDAETPAYMFTELRVGYRSPKRGQGVLFRGDSTPLPIVSYYYVLAFASLAMSTAILCVYCELRMLDVVRIRLDDYRPRHNKVRRVS